MDPVMEKWIETPNVKAACYVWKNSIAALGVGTTSMNGRVKPGMSKQDLLSKKDAGKTLIASFISREVNEKVNLYWKEDNSKKVSQNTTQMEKDTKLELTKNKFMVYKGTPYAKVDFMDKVFVPRVINIFGEDSPETMIATLAAGDGDLWGRWGRHPISKNAYLNIMEKLLWVDQ